MWSGCYLLANHVFSMRKIVPDWRQPPASSRSLVGLPNQSEGYILYGSLQRLLVSRCTESKCQKLRRQSRRHGHTKNCLFWYECCRLSNTYFCNDDFKTDRFRSAVERRCLFVRLRCTPCFVVFWRPDLWIFCFYICRANTQERACCTIMYKALPGPVRSSGIYLE